MHPQSRISGQIRRIKAAQAKAEAEKKSTRRKSFKFEAVNLADAQTRWENWFADNGWTPFEFQRKAWRAYHEGRSALVAVPTGSGKTYAAIGGPLVDMMTRARPTPARTRIIYLTPLKALARDIVHALERPIEEMKLPFHVGLRTGDTSTRERTELRKHAPDILVTTPESLALLLTGATARESFVDVFAVVIDEGHELVGSKRGSLLELTLARLRAFAPQVRISALSATLGNLELAALILTGEEDPLVIREKGTRAVHVDVLAPARLTAAPWFGYAGLAMVAELTHALDPNETQIIFTNTRGQAEAWHRHILEHNPDWEGQVALHHGSLSREERADVEEGAKSGRYRLVVATSSLELGVDFPLVGRVYQIGSVKSLARAVQRAGRGYHRPGESSSLTVCPTSLYELLEIRALKRALNAGVFESKTPLAQPLDVFVQFLLNCAFNEGFTKQEIKDLCATTYSFREIGDAELDWALAFLVSGGRTLGAYPQFLKLRQEGERYVFSAPHIARLHRMNIGTIVSDTEVTVKFMGGKSLGQIAETFASRLKKGDVFQFAGKDLEVMNLRETTLYVRRASEGAEVKIIWTGQILPISAVLASHLPAAVAELAHAEDIDDLKSEELRRLWPAAVKQKRVSHVPRENEILAELWTSREGHHLFLYPFAGRAVHEGLGHLLAYRIAKHKANTISVSCNDHGLELMATEPFPSESEMRTILSDLERLAEDIEASLNFNELSKRAFREVARVSGLIQSSFAGRSQTQRNLQMSSSLLYDVFERYEPGHPLVRQAKNEVKAQQLQMDRLFQEIARWNRSDWIFKQLPQLSPFAFPIFAERIHSRVSTESLQQRIARFQKQVLAGP